MEGDKNKTGTGSLFGNTTGSFGGFSFSASSTTPQSSPAKPSAFGQASSTGSLFGGNDKTGATIVQNPFATNTASSSTTQPSLFGGTVNKPATGTNGSNTLNVLSNSATNANPAGSSPSFNPNPNPPNQAPQSTGLFGSKPPTTNSPLFGNQSTTAGSSNTTSSLPSFNPPTQSIPAPQSTSLFGSKPQATSSTLFGNQSTTAPNAGNPNPASSSPSITPNFNQPNQGTQSTSLFGSKPQTSHSTLFSNSSTTAPKSETPNLPSSSPSITPNPNPPNQAPQAPNIFGSKTAASNNIFANASASNPTKSSPLAQSSTVNNSGGGETTSTTSSTKPTTNTSPTKVSLTTNTASNTTSTSNNKPGINLAPSLLKGKTLEDLVSRWNSELDERVEDFKLTANEIAAWDQVLIRNGDQISALYQELQTIDPIQSSIDQTLDYVETQQSELSAAIDDCERQLMSQQAGGVIDMAMTTEGNNRTRTAAQEREEAYKTAEEVHAQLNDMAGSLGTMIAELNSLAGPGNRIDEFSITDGSNTNMEDPIVQISGILNAHLGSLNWISEITNDLSSKILELESRISNTKLEFGLESNNKQPLDMDDFHHLSLNNNNHNSHGAGSLGFSGTRNLSAGLLSHPRR